MTVQELKNCFIAGYLSSHWDINKSVEDNQKIIDNSKVAADEWVEGMQDHGAGLLEN